MLPRVFLVTVQPALARLQRGRAIAPALLWNRHSSGISGSSPGAGARAYDDQPAPAWPRDDSPIPDVQLRPAPRPDESRDAKLRRLLYQSRKRGILENDILLGTFAAAQLPALTDADLTLYDDLLCENDWDIYYWATNAKPAPAKYEGAVLAAIREIAENRQHKVQRQPERPEFGATA